ncbi:MAG: hypothetical protein U5L00_03230 [Desulfovermiculus sp.]|nr:hypothetical protein [Desulfovermiculus sp.]
MAPNPCSLARSLAEDIHRLEQALAFIHDEAVPELVLALSCFGEAQALPQDEITQVLEDDTADVLLVAFSWRLLLPAPSPRSSMAWEELAPDMRTSTVWKQPAVIGRLVRAACTTGSWLPRQVLPQCSSILPNEPERIESFLDYARQYAPGCEISANLLRAALREAGIHADLERLIIDFKAAGVLSPKLSSLSDTARHASPLYEINPAVFIHSQSR